MNEACPKLHIPPQKWVRSKRSFLPRHNNFVDTARQLKLFQQLNITLQINTALKLAIYITYYNYSITRVGVSHPVSIFLARPVTANPLIWWSLF